jgi:hypothetical protein
MSFPCQTLLAPSLVCLRTSRQGTRAAAAQLKYGQSDVLLDDLQTAIERTSAIAFRYCPTRKSVGRQRSRLAIYAVLHAAARQLNRSAMSLIIKVAAGVVLGIGA